MSNAMTVAITFQDMERLAEAVATSGLFGMKNPSQALALMSIAQAEGMHPALAARDYHVVQNRPVLKSSAMLARFQAAGGSMKYLERTDQRVEAEFTHPQGGKLIVEWDLERAKRAGLASRDNWKSYPRQMLTARVLSEGITAIYPGATGGLLTPEEAADIPPENGERDVTPAPEKPKTGLAALADKVAEKLDPQYGVEPTARELADLANEVANRQPSATSIDEVVAMIQRAKSKEDMDAAVDLARALPEREKVIVRKAYAARLAALREEASAA